jgi:hypothetical protein
MSDELIKVLSYNLDRLPAPVRIAIRNLHLRAKECGLEEVATVFMRENERDKTIECFFALAPEFQTTARPSLKRLFGLSAELFGKDYTNQFVVVAEDEKQI